MKTLPTSDTPRVLILMSKDMAGMTLPEINHGFHATNEILKESSPEGGLLSSSLVLEKSHSNPNSWYKVVLFVSASQLLSADLLDQLGDLTCPLILVIPVITYQLPKSGINPELVESLERFYRTQSLLIGQLATSLSAAHLVLVDGLINGSGKIFSNPGVFQTLVALNLTKPALPNNLSIIAEHQLLKYVLGQLAAPNPSTNRMLVSKPVDGQRLYQKISLYLDQCYQHKTPGADFSQPSFVSLPSVSNVVLSEESGIVSEFVATTKSPTKIREKLSQDSDLVLNRVICWENCRALLSPPPPPSTLSTTTPTRDEEKTVVIGLKNHPDATSGVAWASSLTKTNLTTTQPFALNQGKTDGTSEHPVTVLTPIKSNQQIEKIRQNEENNQKNNFSPSNSVPPKRLEGSPAVSPPSSEIDAQLEGIFAKKRVVEKTDHQVNTKQIKSRIRGKSKRRSGLFVGGAVLTGISLAILFFVGSYSATSTSLLGQVDSMVQELSVERVPPASRGMKALTNLLDWQNQFYDYLFDDSITQRPMGSVVLARLLHRLSLVDQNRNELINQVASGLFVTRNTELLDIEQLIALQSVRLDLWQELLTTLEDSVEIDVAALEKDVTKMKNDRVIMSNLAPHLFQLLGFDQPKTYAVIFQNTQELRSTGGFVQSVGTVTIDKGQIISSQAYSSYEIDKMLGGVVEPPDDLARQLGEKQLFFRDSNWDPNFPGAAKTMVWFLEKSLNTQLDGVLALTTVGLQELLAVTGPLELSDPAQTVSTQNLLEKLEANSGVQGLTPNQPREFSSQVLSAVLGRLGELTPTQTRGLIATLNNGLNEANMLAFIDDSSAQQALADLGWSGAVLTPPCPSPFGQKSCRIDPFYLTENNVGINKANQYVQRKNEASIKIDESSINYRFQISYENKADTSSWPRGSYQAYARIFLPPNVSQLRIVADGKEIDKNQQEISNWENRSVVGFNFEVPIKSSKQVVIEFKTPPLADQDSYVFFMQKQPGVNLQQSRVTLGLPPDKPPQVVSPGAAIGDGEVVFSPTPNPHLLVGLSF